MNESNEFGIQVGHKNKKDAQTTCKHPQDHIKKEIADIINVRRSKIRINHFLGMLSLRLFKLSLKCDGG